MIRNCVGLRGFECQTPTVTIAVSIVSTLESTRRVVSNSFLRKHCLIRDFTHPKRGTLPHYWERSPLFQTIDTGEML